MPDQWNPDTYRQRARQWADKAATLPPGDERMTCLQIAEGYAHLAELIEKSMGSGSS
jgi:hypothetical protein